jgi:type III secretion protein S
MQQTEAIRLTYDALWLVLQLSGPPIVVASLVGVVVALVQAATQLQEQTLQYTLKFIAIVFTLFATGSFLAGSLQAYGDRIFSDFPTMVRR